MTAPISGKVESCSAEVYDRANMNGELCVISGEGEKKVTFYVTQRMLENLSVGDTLTVEKSGKTYDAVINEINTMVDDATGLFKIEAQLADADDAATGSTVKLTVTTGKAENVMTIPVDAVYYSGGKAYVYLYEDGKAEKTEIEAGIYDDENMEVKSGLTSDSQVIVSWSNELVDQGEVLLAQDTDGAQTDGNNETAAETTEAGDKE